MKKQKRRSLAFKPSIVGPTIKSDSLVSYFPHILKQRPSGVEVKDHNEPEVESFLGPHKAADDAAELDGVNFWSDAEQVNLAAKNREKLNLSMAAGKPKQRAELAHSVVEISQDFDNAYNYKTFNLQQSPERTNRSLTKTKSKLNYHDAV